MSAQQISAEDLLPMDTRPAQCTSRKKLQNALFAVNTQQLCNYASQATQISGQDAHLSFKRMPNGSKSNNEICNRANQLNYNLANSSGLRRCLSSTPVLSSPEPVSSSGYCSSTTSNTAIGSNSNAVEQKQVAADDKQTEKRGGGEPKVKYSSSIDSYHNSNTSLNSLNSCDAKALAKSESSGAMPGKLDNAPNGLSDDLTRQTNEQQCALSNGLKSSQEPSSNDKQSIRYPASATRKARSAIRKTESLIEKSHIPTISPASLPSGLSYGASPNLPSHRANQQLQTKNKFRTPTDKICRNAFGFVQTVSRPSADKAEPKAEQNKSDQVKAVRSNAGGHQLSSLNSKRNLATSLSSLPTNNRTPTMLPVLKPQPQTSARVRSATTSSSAKINRTRSQSIQNVNVQSSNFGFNSTTSAKSRPVNSALCNRSKQLYNSSTSLNSAPASRSKKLPFSSSKTSSTNNLDLATDFASTGTKIRYQNYLTSSQHITNQQAAAAEQSDLESSTSSKFSNESNPVSKLRRPSLRAF